MKRITPEELADLRSQYPGGSRVKLICMNDPYIEIQDTKKRNKMVFICGILLIYLTYAAAGLIIYSDK